MKKCAKRKNVPKRWRLLLVIPPHCHTKLVPRVAFRDRRRRSRQHCIRLPPPSVASPSHESGQRSVLGPGLGARGDEVERGADHSEILTHPVVVQRLASKENNSARDLLSTLVHQTIMYLVISAMACDASTRDASSKCGSPLAKSTAS
jgi:hypothetical protein